MGVTGRFHRDSNSPIRTKSGSNGSPRDRLLGEGGGGLISHLFGPLVHSRPLRTVIKVEQYVLTAARLHRGEETETMDQRRGPETIRTTQTVCRLRRRSMGQNRTDTQGGGGGGKCGRDGEKQQEQLEDGGEAGQS